VVAIGKVLDLIDHLPGLATEVVFRRVLVNRLVVEPRVIQRRLDLAGELIEVLGDVGEAAVVRWN
jgi:hypothetical protein